MHALLIIKRESDSFHVDGIFTADQKKHLERVCSGRAGQVMTEFTMEKLEVRFQTPNGSIVILHT